jgi:peroxiredoxin
MKRLACCLALLSFAILVYLALPARSDTKDVKQTTKIDNFTLKDATGKAWSLSDVKENKAVVVLFLGTECPINNAYLPRLVELNKEYSGKGVTFVAINANHQDTVEKIAKHAKEHALPFPVLKDVDNKVADQFGAKRTPAAFLLDAERVVRYEGRIDDQIGVGFKRTAPTRNDLVEALNEVLAGKTVTQAKTDVAGCLISRAVAPMAEGTVTYAKQVSRVLQKNCQECHRPGQIGPMALLTYEDAADWSAMIKEVVSDRRMPPWHADPKFGHFANDRRLSDADRDAILDWIKQGCPKGDSKDLPEKRDFASAEWRIGKPDIVFTMDKEFTVVAKAPKGGVPYQYFGVETNFDEDKWVQAAEAKPGNFAVVHHIVVYVVPPGEKPGKRREDPIGEGFLVPYAPGDMPAVFPEGAAKKIPKGATLIFQMHYTPNGAEQTDRSSVALIFAKKPPEREVKTRAVAQRDFVIPAGEENHKVVSSVRLKEDSLVMSLLPHMHLRGKDFEYRVTYPDGKEETILSVPKYDFNWQASYRFEKPLALPAGTRIECTAHFDNSKNNPNNPDPDQAVKWGDQTWQEMMIGFVDYVATPKKDAKP